MAKSNIKAELFLPKIFKKIAHSSPTFTKDGLEMYWSTVPVDDKPRTIYSSKYLNNNWSEPEVVSFSGIYNDDHPFISPDGKVLYFASNRPTETDSEMKLRIWKMSQTDSGWDDLNVLEGPIGFWTPSITQKGTLYYIDSMDNSYRSDSSNRCGIYRSELVDSMYKTAELLPEDINLEGCMNWCPYISQDESFLLFSSDRPGSSGSGDLYVSFKTETNQWTKVINLGHVINTENQERFPGLSPDGKNLFFTRSCGEPNYHDLYKIEADFLEELKEQTLLQSK